MEITRPESEQPIPENAKKMFKGILFDVYQWEQKLFNGQTATYEKLKRPDTAVVFAVLPDGKILLAEQEQPGKKPFISALGGRIDEGEDPLAGAKRELLEESGYEADEFILWRAEQATSKIEWAVYTFIAKGLNKVSEPHFDGGEKIKLKPVTFTELLELTTNNRFSEQEVIPELLRAKFDPKQRARLEKMFQL